jgi:putative transposase
VARLMRAENLYGRRKKKQPRTTNSQHSYPVAPNRLNRDFQATRPNEKRLADITYIPTAEGWLYLAVVLDLFSRKIIGWAFAEMLESRLVEQAFNTAVQNRQPLRGLLHHSDRGSQYAATAYQQLLTTQRIQVSMSHSGDCYDDGGAVTSQCPDGEFLQLEGAVTSQHLEMRTRSLSKLPDPQ